MAVPSMIDAGMTRIMTGLRAAASTPLHSARPPTKKEEHESTRIQRIDTKNQSAMDLFRVDSSDS
jgi:hypothetical protein